MTSTVRSVTAYPLAYSEPNNANKTRHVTLVRLETKDGVVGWGEAITGTAAASRSTAFMVEHELAPMVVGTDPRRVGATTSEMHEATYWTGAGGLVTMGISAIDTALWDIAGKVAGQPVWALLGGKQLDRIRAASSIIFDTGDVPGIGRQFADLHASGFEVLKGGWGHDLSKAFGTDRDRDVEIVRTIREAVGDRAEIIVDVVARSGWTVNHAIQMAHAFEPYRLYWLEDALPEDDLSGWRRLSRSTATPLCTGEKGYTFAHFRHLIRSGSLALVMLDVARVEGITGARRIIEYADAHGIAWNAHSWSSAINTAASIHLAAASRNVRVLELKPVPSPMQDELVTRPFVMTGGSIAVPDEPGLGIEVDERVVRRYALG